MPTLPTAADFGRTPSGAGGGGIVSAPKFRVSDQVAQSADAGDALQEMGRAMEAAENKLTEARRSAQLSDAVSRATGELGELEVKYQQDSDFKTMRKRSGEEMDGIRAKYEQGIDDPAVREAFNSHFQQLSTTKQVNFLKMAVQKEGDYHVAGTARAMDAYAKGAAFAANDAERDLMQQQASITIHGMAAAGWITREEAQKQESGFARKVDEARVQQDLFNEPANTANRLSFDPEYAKNLDPLARIKMAEIGWTDVKQRANEERIESERLRNAQANEIMKNAADLDYRGKMSWGFIQQARNIVTDSDYKSLVHMMEEKASSGGVKRDDPGTVIAIEEAMMRNPDEAARLALKSAKAGQIKASTLSGTISRARTIERQEGPKSEYERGRNYVTNMLAPGPLVTDAAAKARFGLAMREYEDFANGGNRSDDELRKKVDDVVRNHSMVNMEAIARKSSIGGRAASKPEQVIEQIDRAGRELMEKRKTGKITPQEFNRELAKLKAAKDAAEKARTINGR